MKLTVITSEKGEVLGAMKGHMAAADTSQKPNTAAKQFRAGLRAGEGQRLHEIEGPDTLEGVEDPVEFHKVLTEHIKKNGLPK